MVRAPFYDENGVKKGAWSAEEDEKLKAYVQKHGHCNWRELPRFAGLTRCGKSCRLRWINYLRPDVKRGNYSKEEENLILKLHQQHGNKWSLIATRLPGRTDNEIKNYWHTHLKKLKTSKVTKKEQNEAIPKPKAIQKRESSSSSSEINKAKLANELIIASHQIFESSPLSPLSSELSSNVFSTQESAASTIDMAAEENSPAPTTTSFQEPKNGDFWAHPFELEDNCLEVESEQSMYFDFIAGFNSPYDLIFDEDLLNYQVMKELPQKITNLQVYD